MVCEVTVWVAFAVSYMDEMGYPRLDPSYDILRVTQVRVADGLLKVPNVLERCLASM